MSLMLFCQEIIFVLAIASFYYYFTFQIKIYSTVHSFINLWMNEWMNEWSLLLIKNTVKLN